MAVFSSYRAKRAPRLDSAVRPGLRRKKQVMIDAANLSLLSLAHAPAVLQRSRLGRIQATLDSPACPEGLLRHGGDSAGVSGGPADIQPGAVDDGTGGRVRP